MGTNSKQDPKSFWLSIPGFPTALASLITAFTGLYAVMHNSSGSSEKAASEKIKTDNSAVASMPPPKTAAPQVVRLTSVLPQGTMASYGFFTPKGFIVVATHTIGKDGLAFGIGCPKTNRRDLGADGI